MVSISTPWSSWSESLLRIRVTNSPSVTGEAALGANDWSGSATLATQAPGPDYSP